MACTTASGAAALLAHLRWWLSEEAAFADSYGQAYRVAQVRVADLTALACACWPTTAVGPDPIYRAIATAQTAEAAHSAALSGLDEDNDVQVRRANAAADASSAAFEALTTVTPTTRAGLFALAELYAREAEEVEPMCAGGQYQHHLATALKGSDSRALISDLSPADLAPWPALDLKLGSVEEETDDEEEPVQRRADHRHPEGAAGRATGR